MKEKYDVVVVGAGPAGSMAARATARGGARVLMLDKRRELGVPVQCGEALNEGVLKELKIAPDPRWALNKTNAVKLVSPSGIEVRIVEKEVMGKIGYILDRKIFDKHLAILAAKEGADVMVGALATGLMIKDGRVAGVKGVGVGGKFEFFSDIVIAADGVGSRVARWAGLNTALKLVDIESGAQFQMVDIDFESQTMMEFYFGNKIAAGGYAWVFPKGDHMANVGLGVLGGRAEGPAIDYLRAFVEKMPNLRKGKIIEINAGGVPVSGPLERTVKDGLLVVGDAARQVNALTGGGIDHAMRAGDIAGEVAAKAVSEGDTSEKRLMEYEKRWRELMGKRLERYLKAKNVLVSLTDDDLDKLAKALSEVKFEGISLTGMLRVLLKAHPKLLWKLRGLM
ncbi:MAG: NAD(P)/FAD-dependent oxidoreductase [Candidatus Hodarchaeaceae archaeon]|nr:NAD(P)/FAD-dependent oxidoreductase [Candidatus Hodarchaeaceae archaeon]